MYTHISNGRAGPLPNGRANWHSGYPTNPYDEITFALFREPVLGFTRDNIETHTHSCLFGMEHDAIHASLSGKLCSLSHVANRGTSLLLCGHEDTSVPSRVLCFLLHMCCCGFWPWCYSCAVMPIASYLGRLTQGCVFLLKKRKMPAPIKLDMCVVQQTHVASKHSRACKSVSICVRVLSPAKRRVQCFAALPFLILGRRLPKAASSTMKKQAPFPCLPWKQRWGC